MAPTAMQHAQLIRAMRDAGLRPEAVEVVKPHFSVHGYAKADIRHPGRIDCFIGWAQIDDVNYSLGCRQQMAISWHPLHTADFYEACAATVSLLWPIYRQRKMDSCTCSWPAR